jgi:hypothetical protein
MKSRSRLAALALCAAACAIPGAFPAPAAPARDDRPVVSQKPLGVNACGPCAVVNALLRAKPPYRDVLESLEGDTPAEKARTLIGRFGKTPSKAYDGEMAYQPERGITWVDMTACLNALLKDRQAPSLEGSYLDRRRDEPLGDHLRRIHGILAASIRKGMPVVTSVRSFAPKPKKEGEHVWTGLNGHYITITAVQERIDKDEKGFRFMYADSFTGRLDTGYAHVDEARNFTAAKGDAKRWEWVSDRPFLLVTAPSLRLSTQKQPWHLRTIIILNYAVYAR